MNALTRRRFQRGSIKDGGDRWEVRWREDVIEPSTGEVRRKYKWDLLSKKSFPTKRLAQRELEKKLELVNRDDYHPTADGITFAQFADKWQQTVMIHHKPSSRDAERSTIRCNLLPVFGPVLLRDITAERIQMWANSWKKSGKTFRNALAPLMDMWDHAKAWGYVSHNPFPRGTSGKLLLKRPKEKMADTYNFTLEETLAIIDKATGKWKLLFRTLAEGGMRPGELAGMRKTDLVGRVIRLSQSVYRQHIQTQKTANSVREFPISQELANDLRAYMQETQGQKNNFNLVWTNGAGNPVPMNKVLSEVLNPILEELGIRQRLQAAGIDCGLYAFRHMNITELRRRNVPLKTIQKRVGHAQGSDVTDRHYVHSVSEDDLAAADLLGELLNSKPQGPIQ